MGKKLGKKLTIGVLAALVIAVAGYFGVGYYAQHVAEAEVEQAFAQIRARGASARFRSVTLDPAGRGITLSGVEVASQDGAVRVSVDKLAATGATAPRDGYAEADALDLDGVTLAVSDAASGKTVTYAIPKVMIDRYGGPVAPVAPQGEEGGSAAYGALTLALRQLAATTAAKVTIPQMSARIDTGPQAGAAKDAPLEVAYEGIAAEQLTGGKIRSLIVDAISFTGSAPAAGRVEGKVTGIVAARISTAPILAAATGTPPATQPDDYQEIYGKVVTGPYVIKYPDGETSSARSLLMEHVGIKPSAFTKERMAAFEALSRKEQDLSIEEAGELIERAADVLDSVAFGTLAVTGAGTASGQESVRMDAVRFTGFASGVLDSFELEGVDGRDAGGQALKMGRLALRRFDLLALVRLAKEVDAEPLGGMLGLFKVVAGVEAAGIEVPYGQGTGAAAASTLKVGNLNLSWGSFMGALPSTLTFQASDVTGPISAGDGEPFTYLANAGMTSATAGALLKVTYDPDTKTLAIDPLNLKVNDAFSVRLEGAVGNLPKETFADAAGALGALSRFSGKPVMLRIENLGLASLMVTQLAQAAGVTPEAFKQDLIASIDEEAQHWSEVTRDAPAVAEALKAFILDPKVLTITARPRSTAPLMPLIASDQPLALLQAFDITATTEP